MPSEAETNRSPKRLSERSVLVVSRRRRWQKPSEIWEAGPVGFELDADAILVIELQRCFGLNHSLM